MSIGNPSFEGEPSHGSSGVYRVSAGPTADPPSGSAGDSRDGLPVIPHVRPELIANIAAEGRSSSTDELHPLVNGGDLDDADQGHAESHQASDSPGMPRGRRWQGWRRGSGGARRPNGLQAARPSSSERVQATRLEIDEPQRPADERLHRWWRLCGLEPKSNGQHPREDVRFTSVILATFFALEIFVNFDCGAIPCTLAKLADEFRLSPTWQGMLGALPYVGLTLASPFAGRVFAQWRAKRVIVISMALNAAATLLMVLTILLPSELSGQPGSSGEAATGDSVAAAGGAAAGLLKDDEGPLPASGKLKPFFYLPDFSFVDMTPSAVLLLCSRLLVGFTQAPFVIYAPVWVDEFAPPKKAALWMGIMQGAAVVGVTAGYLSAGVLSVYFGLNWRSAIGIQVFFLCLLTGITAFFPREFVETPGSGGGPPSRGAPCPSAEGIDLEGQHALGGGRLTASAGSAAAVELRPANSCEQFFCEGPSPQQQMHAEADAELTPRSAAAAQSTSRPGEGGAPPLDNAEREETPADALEASTGHRRAAWALMSTPMYVSPMLTLCALLFVVTGVQFWGTVFFASSLGLTPTVAMLAFAAVAATSPVAGVVIGGVTVDAVGGYKTLSGRTRTLYACTAYAAIAVAAALIGSFTSDAYLCIASLWFLLCFGAAMLPPLTGVQIDAVAPQLRTLASGMSMFFYNILGYALGAFLPGVVMDLFNGSDILGLRLVLLWSFFGLFFVALTAVYARRLEKRGDSRLPFSSHRQQLCVIPPADAHAPRASLAAETARKTTGPQGFLPIPGEATWRQQQHTD
ncbi:hypothetical protein Efla_001187 [Eimeria flavescens]